MSRTRVALLCSTLALGTVAGICQFVFPTVAVAEPDFPTPNVYPISWELSFKHGTPRRIVVDVPNAKTPKAFWYLTYTVTNDTDKEQNFYPEVQLLTEDGNTHDANKSVNPRVFEQIKAAERNKFLEDFTSLTGAVRIGAAEARDGVAIWPETVQPAGHFSVFVTGLSGEAVTMKKDVAGKYVKIDQAQDLADPKQLVILRKTLQLKYLIRGNETYPAQQDVVDDGEESIMR